MRLPKNYTKKTGLPPGKIVFTGKKKMETSRVHLIQYNEQQVKEEQIKQLEKLQSLPQKAVSWIDICGLHETELLDEFGQIFGLHPLILEDIAHIGQRAKLEEFDDYFFLVIKMLYFENDELIEEQVSTVLGPNYVLTFQEKPGDVFEPLRQRIRSQKYRISKSGPDYLFYSLMDIIVDNYFVVLEKIGDTIEDLEEELLNNPDRSTLQKIHLLKRNLFTMRRAAWPLREVVSRLDRSESELIQETTKIYLRDVYDHLIQVLDNIENYREILAGMLDLYLSSLSNRMNEVMKTLTIIATIFIPLTFIAGIYGMNFEYMPELKWHWGYFFTWFVMIIIAGMMLILFKKRKWL